LNRLLRLAAFQNPEFYKAQKMRLSTYGKPRVIACGEDLAEHVALPRGCFPETIALLDAHGVYPNVRDERSSGTPIEVEFKGELRPHQLEAVSRAVQHDDGILCAPTAFGKTAVAAWLIAKRKVNALVMVHRQQLRSMARAVGNVLEPARDGNRADWRWEVGPDWTRGHCGHPEPALQRRGEGFCRRVWPGNC
jgi:hypothetical protein